MKMFPNRSGLPALLLAAALGLAACDDDDGGDSTPPPPETQQLTEVTESEICTRTDDAADPIEINGLDVEDSEEAIDVSASCG